MTAEYIEYTGEEPHGNAFLSSHTVTKGDPLWKRTGVEIPADLVWERDPSAPIGTKTQMRVETKGLPPEAVAALVKLPGYKRVTA